MHSIPLKKKIYLIVFGLFLCVFLLEIGLRIAGSVVLSLQEYRNKVSLREKGAYRIMCLGESTTAAGGGENSYPSLLEDVLNNRDTGVKFSVVNKGVIGTDTDVILSSLGDNLDRYKPDMIIAMMGINDRRLGRPSRHGFTKENKVFIQRSRVYKLVELLRLHAADRLGVLKKDLDSIYSNSEEKEASSRQTALSMGAYGAYVKRGILYRDKGEYGKAETVFGQAIEIDPEESDAYFESALCYRYQGKYAKAERMFKNAVRLDPLASRRYLELGRLYAVQGKYTEAEKMFEKAIRLKPDNYRAYFELGILYKEQEDYNKAKRIFREIIERGLRRDDLIFAALGDCYKRLREYRLADECFDKVNGLMSEYCNTVTLANYQRLRDSVIPEGIKLVCVQYPMRSIEPLKKIFGDSEAIIFVDNERIFKKVVKKEGYDEYFADCFGGDFGHCTDKGNRLLAENIADVILEEHFNQI